MKWRAAIVAALLVAAVAGRAAPVPVVFDTDIGNDVDDVLALSVLHALESRGECRILGVTVTKPDELAGPFVDAMDTFYGRPEIPVGCVRPVAGEPPSRFLSLAEKYPHRLKRGSDAAEPARLLRKLLAGEPDHSVVLVQVGYFSNFAALLDSSADDVSPLSGRELAARKVKLLSVMAGAFQPEQQQKHFLEFNVIKDIAAARKVAANWPTPVVWSGFEIGAALPYPAESVEHDFGYVAHHPAAEAFRLYLPPRTDRPSWDLTAALYAVRPERGYFDLSPPGKVTVDFDGFTHFAGAVNGRDRFLILKPGQKPRVEEALRELASQPPDHCPAGN